MLVFASLLMAMFSFSAELPLHLIAGCRVLEIKTKTQITFPGTECIFHDDGSFISMGDHHLRKIGIDGKILWEMKNERYHHQLNPGADADEMIVLGSRYLKDSTGEVRLDEFMVVDLNGKIRSKASAEILFKDKILLPKLFPPFSGITETSHFNSFHPIPEKWKHRFPADSAYILNSLGQGILLVDRNLKKVTAKYRIIDARSHLVHDVQVGHDGNLLMFINELKNTPARASAIYSYNQKSDSGKILFSAFPAGIFYSPLAGSVQEWGSDEFIISDVHRGTLIVNKKDGAIRHFFQETHWEGLTSRYVQQVRGADLTKFFASRGK